MDGLISINGSITSLNKATISPLDRGFLFADAIFEVIVAFHGKLLDLHNHLERLRTSADLLKIPIPWSDEELRFELNELVNQLSAPKLYLRLVVTRGEGLGLNADSNMQPNRYVYVMSAKREPASTYELGINLKRKNLPYTDRGLHAKTNNYLRSILAIQDVIKEGYDDVLWANSESEFTEASTANIFFIGREGDLVEIATPSSRSGLLNGITKKRIQTLLTHTKIANSEKTIFVDELARFDEAFLCSTVKGLVPINKIDRHQLHTCRKNSVFRKIERLYLTWLQSQIGIRVNWNTGLKITTDE
ncbi:MAG: aminotransferase class IV [Bdellovibrionota bacterium]